MREVKVFVHLASQHQSNPITQAMKSILPTLGDVVFMDNLVHDAREADIAIIGSLEEALHVVKNTTKTVIIFMYHTQSEKAEVATCIVRFSKRVVKAIPYIRAEGDPTPIDLLRQIITAFSQ